MNKNASIGSNKMPHGVPVACQPVGAFFFGDCNV